MLHVGFENYFDKSKVLGITELKGEALIRLRQNAEDARKYIDCTRGRKTLSLVHLLDGFVVGSPVRAETLLKRMELVAVD